MTEKEIKELRALKESLEVDKELMTIVKDELGVKTPDQLGKFLEAYKQNVLKESKESEEKVTEVSTETEVEASDKTEVSTDNPQMKELLDIVKEQGKQIKDLKGMVSTGQEKIQNESLDFQAASILKDKSQSYSRIANILAGEENPYRNYILKSIRDTKKNSKEDITLEQAIEIVNKDLDGLTMASEGRWKSPKAEAEAKGKSSGKDIESLPSSSNDEDVSYLFNKKAEAKGEKEASVNPEDQRKAAHQEAQKASGIV